MSNNEITKIHNTLMLSRFKSICIVQSWILGLNPTNPINFAFPTWITLMIFSYKHYNHAFEIALTHGGIVGADPENEGAQNPKLCVNLEVCKGWVTNIALNS